MLKSREGQFALLDILIVKNTHFYPINMWELQIRLYTILYMWCTLCVLWQDTFETVMTLRVNAWIFVTEQLIELHRGQGMDIYWRDAHKCPTEEEYKEMVIRSKVYIWNNRYLKNYR